MLEAINTPVLVIQVRSPVQSTDGDALTPSFLLFGKSESSQIYPLEHAQSLVDSLKNAGKDARLFVVKGKSQGPQVHDPNCPVLAMEL